MRNQDYVITGLQSWDIPIGSNAKNIALEISRHNRVLYVNPPASVVGIGRRPKPGIRRISQTLWVVDLPVVLLPVNVIGNNKMFDIINGFNNYIYGRSILRVVRELDLHNYIHINDNDIFRGRYLKRYLKPKLEIYYRRDWLFEVQYWKRQGPRLEAELCAESDLVLSNSPHLAQTVQQFNPRSYYIGQGVDLSSFLLGKNYELPADLAAVARPVVGYAGAISSLRLDAQLICDIARLRPDYTFVMVGPEDTYFSSHLIHELSNVKFLGAKSPEQLPAYIAGFDVCINVQKVNPTTIGNYPRKIDEYLAMGKGVVVTETPTMQIFDGYVSMAVDADGYCHAIDELVASVNDGVLAQGRAEFANSHTWTHSVGVMYDRISDILDTKQ